MRKPFHRYNVERYSDAWLEAHRLLIKAAEEWASGDGEQPATSEVLNSILEVFVQQKFLNRPYGTNTEL